MIARAAQRLILAKRHLPRLAEFALANVVIAFDFDGTLAPIVADPARARIRATTRRLLADVAVRYPCVVISGRARHDLVRRVGALPVFHLAGNHGLEPWAPHAAFSAQVQNWVRHLRTRLATYSGVVVEDKTYSVTVHYRRARRRRQAIAAIADAVGGLRGVRTLGGVHAISLVPRGAPTKGEALERARRLLFCDAAIYLGDDGTDEDAFTSGHPDRLLAIRVGVSRHSRAAYCVRNQTEVDDFLRALLAFRPVRTTPGRPTRRATGRRAKPGG